MATWALLGEAGGWMLHGRVEVESNETETADQCWCCMNRRCVSRNGYASG